MKVVKIGLFLSFLGRVALYSLLEVVEDAIEHISGELENDLIENPSNLNPVIYFHGLNG